jgi:predicted nucleotidyltransferase
MVRLPEKIRGALEKLVSKLKENEKISAISLFGSWSRGDAVSSSDVDLLIVDERDFPGEFVERIEVRGVLIDLNYIPKKWILSVMPREIDQKMYESYVLYDRDWSFTNSKEWMMKVYKNPERLNIRTESYMVNADIYLSRAASALSREDYQSVCIFAEKSAETIMRIPVDICQLPISKSRFLKNLDRATERLKMTKIYAEYLALTNLFKVEREEAEKTLNNFKKVWSEIAVFTKRNAQLLEESHFRVKSKLNYYFSPLFLQGTMLRARGLIDSGENGETIRYLKDVLLDMLENYTWVKAKAEKTRVDSTTLIRNLKEIAQEKPNIIYEKTTQIFKTEEVNRQKAQKAIEKA